MSVKLALTLAEPYRVISRYDSAINLPPEPAIGPRPDRKDGESDEEFRARAEAWAAPLREWGKPLRVARETGDYKPILKDGEQPTIFVLRQITATEWTAIDSALARVDGSRAAMLLLARIGVLRLEGDAPTAANLAPEVDAAFPELGKIQPPKFVDLFTGTERILLELAEVIVDRRHTPPN